MSNDSQCSIVPVPLRFRGLELLTHRLFHRLLFRCRFPSFLRCDTCGQSRGRRLCSLPLLCFCGSLGPLLCLLLPLLCCCCVCNLLLLCSATSSLLFLCASLLLGFSSLLFLLLFLRFLGLFLPLLESQGHAPRQSLNECVPTNNLAA